MTRDEPKTEGDGRPPAVRPPGGPKPRRTKLVLALLLLVAGGAGGWYAWRSYHQAKPPAVDLDGVDPEVASALTAARAEVHRSPRSADVWGKFGKTLAAHGYLEEARACFVEAERLQPEEACWPYGHGLMLVFNDNDAAIVQFQRTVRLRGAGPAMRFRLAEALAAQGRPDEAREHYRLLLDDPDLSPRAELGLARLAYQRGDLETARASLDRAALEPETKKASHSLLAEIAQRSDDPAAAVRERAVVGKLPDDPDAPDPFVAEMMREKKGKNVRLARALKLVRQGHAEEAAREFQDMVRAYPDWDQGWLNYGRLLMEHRAYPPAEEAFRAVVRLALDSVNGHFQLGLALLQQGDFRRAEAHFREAVRLKPDYALAYCNVGHCLKRLDDRAGAIAAFREALRFRPDMARARTSLGELLAEQGDKPAAIEEVRLSLVLNPDDETSKKLWERLGQEKPR